MALVPGIPTASAKENTWLPVTESSRKVPWAQVAKATWTRYTCSGAANEEAAFQKNLAFVISDTEQ